MSFRAQRKRSLAGIKTRLSYMTAILSVFPDTNLFLQCKPLRELDWTLLGHEGDIELLITRPVQAELDAFKAKGNSRQASKSRSATTLIAELLVAPEEGLVLRQNPTVRLRMARAMRPDPAAANELNYDSRDDQLVGIALAFHKASSETSALLLTYDHGPMFSAREVGVPFRKIPDEWLLPPEPDDAARKESALRSELERYQKSEPKFEIALLEASGQSLDLSFTTYSSLTDSEIASLLAGVYSRYPEVTDFGPSESSESVVRSSVFGAAIFGEEKEVFTPATPEEIEHYQRSYVEWKEACKDYLQDIHEALNKRLDWPTLTTRISNVGSRPADDALVELVVKGSVRVVRPRRRHEDEEPKSDDAPKFPRPPIAPSGRRKRVRSPSPFTFAGAADALAAVAAGKNHLNTVSPLRNFSASRDPNNFYWKDVAQGIPVAYVSLECQQWRHARDPEDFIVALQFSKEAGVHSGSLTVTVHAANLTNPTSKIFPIRVNVARISPSAEVERQIEELAAAPTRLRLT